uniref:Structural maintenance of chromosomes protein n=1 Tax=Tetrahymena thermophila TaxID=5911 RepID=Q6PUA5_TETTH|nr:condensin subunit [Tetrahymena thermophila]
MNQESTSKVQAQMEEEIPTAKSVVKHTQSLLKNSVLRQNLAGKSEQRLIVKQIVLENFKSYQGRQVIGPFHKRFTSVVGPNGSGKSNLIESLLFVFGKKASWMRLKKLEQLIHNSSKHQNVKKASVEVTFHEIRDKEGEEYEVIPGTEFTVRRTVNKSSVSKYEINDKEVSHVEVTDTLKQKGIDLTNNRFLILQGEVEQISLMKPRSGDPEKPGLLEYLEDIIGSNQFKEDIEKKDEEYEVLQNERREKGERMRIHEADLEKLQESKNLAIEYIRNEKLSYQMTNIIGQIDLLRSKKDIEKFETKIKQNEQQNVEMREKFKQQLKENEQVIKEYKQSKAEIEKKDYEVQKYKGQLKKLNERDELIRQKLVLETENQTKAEKQLEDLQDEYKKAIRDQKEYQSELPEKQDRLRKLLTKKDDEDEKLRELKSKVNNENQKLVKEKKEMEKKLQPIKEKKLEVQSKRDTLQNRFTLISQDATAIQNEYEKNQNELEKAKQLIEDQHTLIKQIAQAIQAIEAGYEKQEADNKECRIIEEKIIKAISECKQKIDQTKQSNQDSQTRNKVLNELMIAQQQGKLRGICGRLGDLAAINEEYDVAITTACGQLDNIIVDRYDDAQNAVNYLRKEKIGKAQFIALDKIEHNRQYMEKQFQCPRGSQRLFDLIQFKDQKYKVAFYFALRNTLVCDNIDLATEIAYGQQRHRVVTKKGELIDDSGVMSGGGAARRGGVASQLKVEISPEEVERYQAEYSRNQQDLEQIRETIQNTNKQLNTFIQEKMYLVKQLEAKKFDQQLQEDNVTRCQNRLKALQKQMDEQEQNAKERQVIKQELEKFESEYHEYDGQIMELNKKITDIDEKINKSGGQELKQQQEICKNIQNQTLELQADVNKKTAKLKDLEKTLKNNEREKNETQERIKKIKASIDPLKDQQQKLEEDAVKVFKDQQQAGQQLAMLQEQQKQRDEQKAGIEKIIKDMKDALEKLKKEKDDFEAKINKAKEDQNRSEHVIANNRNTYKEITKSYDFLQFIDEIAGYQINESEDKKSDDQNNLDNISILEESIMQSMMDEEKNTQDKEDDEEIPENNDKQNKKIRSSKNTKKISSIDVYDDIGQELIEQLENHRESLKIEKAKAEEKLKSMTNDANITTITEFKNKYIEFKSKKEEFERVKNRISELKVDIDRLKKERFEKFMSGFNLISAKLKETYQTLTNGGDAELELIDSLDPFSDGVNFTVRPPKKSWKQISKLSGGEKTLSSLSLVFALHYYKPTPLYFMDEIDAALDFKNVSIVGNYIQERTKNAQFIIISLRNNMFELANKLVGVYKTYDTTKTIAIIPELIYQKIQHLNDDKTDTNQNQNEDKDNKSN